MNDPDSPLRARAAQFVVLGLRLSACLTAAVTLAIAAITLAVAPALAATHPRRHTAHARRPLRRPSRRRGFARAEVSTLTRWRPQVHEFLARHEITGRCPDAAARIGRAPTGDIDRAILCLLNQQRATRGLPRLRLSRLLDRSAQNWTNTMVHDRSFSHGSDFGARISSVGFDWSQIGENIADGYRTPIGVVKAWMASTGHCVNILSPDFREVGAGFDSGTALGRDSDHGTWTIDLGLLMHQRPPSSDWRPAEGCPY